MSEKLVLIVEDEETVRTILKIPKVTLVERSAVGESKARSEVELHHAGPIRETIQEIRDLPNQIRAAGNGNRLVKMDS